MYRYRTFGTCSFAIEFDVKGGIVSDVTFFGGCRGNAQGIAKLAEGRPAAEVAALLKGVRCRNGTSCPDQLACALEALAAGEHGNESGARRLTVVLSKAETKSDRDRSTTAEPDRESAEVARKSELGATRPE